MKAWWLLLLAAPAAGAEVLQASACADPERFERVYAAYLDDARAIAKFTAHSDHPDSRIVLDGVEAFARQFRAQDTTARDTLCALFERQPMFAESTRLARQQLESASLAPVAEQLAGADRAARLCLSNDQYLAAFAGQQLLEAGAIVAEAYCDASSCSIPPLFVTCFETPVCSFSCPIATVARLIAQGASIVMTLDDRCRSERDDTVRGDLIEDSTARLAAIDQEFTDLFVPRWNVPISSRASGASALSLDQRIGAGIAGTRNQLDDLSDALASLDQQTGTSRTVETRVDFELQLVSAGSSQASLLWPRSVGGNLEDVRETVSEALLGLEAIGEDMGPALAEFALGDAALNAGDYQGAFAAYQRAYQLAAILPVRAP